MVRHTRWSVLLLLPAILATPVLAWRPNVTEASRSPSIVARLPSRDAPGQIAVDRRGGMYVGLEEEVQKLSPHGTLTARWKLNDVGGRAVALDRAGNVYVGMALSIEKRSPTGAVLATWKTPGRFGCGGLAIGSDGALYVVSGRTVYVLSPSTRRVRRLVDYSTGRKRPLRYTFVNAIAVDRLGNVYLAHDNDSSGGASLPAIQKFSPAGKLLAQWGRFGTQPRDIEIADGIAVDQQGNVYVSDLQNNRIERYSTSGQLRGTLKDQSVPRYLTVDALGNLYAEVYLGNQVDAIERASRGTF